MKFRLTVLIVFSLCLSNVFADEGMWLLGNLRKNKQTDRVMKELGLQMPVNKIYNPKKPCSGRCCCQFWRLLFGSGGFRRRSGVYQSSLWFQQYPAAFFRRT